MKIPPTVCATVFALVSTVALATIVFAQTGALSLFIHGSAVSSDVRIIDGRAYVPLIDIARAYHQTLVKRPDGFDLTDASASPAPQSPAPEPVASESAGWSLTVTGVDQVLAYNLRYDPSANAVAPASADEGLVVVNCRVVNGSASARTFGLSNYFTTLTDDQGKPHKPLAFDAGQIRAVGAFRGVTVPAHGTGNLAVVFSISQEASPKTFAFSLMNLSDAGFDTAHRKDVRVPLL